MELRMEEGGGEEECAWEKEGEERDAHGENEHEERNGKVSMGRNGKKRRGMKMWAWKRGKGW